MDNFDDRYLGAKASDPALDNDGNALAIGALYFNTTDGVMKVYTASGWIAASSASVATLATFEFVATAGQTVFTGNDANGTSLSYVAPAIIVTLNGVRLRPGDDYTATNGTSLTLVSAAALNDELVVDAFGSFLVANAVDLTTTQTIAGIKSFSNPITASAGTVSAPGITTTGDSNTGIFFPAADTIAFAEGGTEVMRIDSAGNLGIGTNSPVGKVESKTGNVTSGSANYTQKSFVANTSYSTTNIIASMLSGWDGSTIHGVDVGYFYNGTGYNLSFSTNEDTVGSPVERMRINHLGRILSQPTGGGALIEQFGCRAWVNFDGTSTPSIRSSGNVSSITDFGTGNYGINFSTNMPDANYAPFYCDYSWGNGYADTLTTSSYKVQTLTSGFSAQDTNFIYTGIFR